MRTDKLKLKVITGLVASTLGLGMVTSLSAADNQYDRSATPSAGSATKQQDKMTHKASEASAGRDLRASKVIGMKIHNAQGESLGKIDDLIIDVNNERVAYAILSFGGAVGVGDKLFAYPLSLFKPAADRNDQLVLNVDKEKLKSAPGFEGKNWPDWNQAKYRGDVDKYFGPTVSPKAMPNQRLARASDLIGKDVDDRSGKDAGEIDDLVVNLGNSKVHYAVLDFDKKWSMDDKLLPLPLKSFTFPGDRKKDLVLNVARSELDMSHAFDDRNWPDIGDPGYRANLDSYLERTAAGPRPAGQPGQAGPVRREGE